MEELAAEAAAAEPDFYEEFQPDRQLVLRSAWLCAGAGSLAAMRARLAQRILLLEALEEDGWQLDAPVRGRLVAWPRLLAAAARSVPRC